MYSGVIAASGRRPQGNQSSFILPVISDGKGMFISSDGSKMYVCGFSNTYVYEYDMSTPWDITTLSYNNVRLDVSAQGNFLSEIEFSSDGLHMFICDALPDVIYRYDLTVAWDLSTATYANISLDTTSQQGAPSCFTFSSDGLTLFVGGGSPNGVFKYDLTVAWDLSTATYSTQSFSPSISSLTGLYLRDNNQDLFLMGIQEIITRNNMSTPLDLNTATFTGDTLDLSSFDSFGESIFFKDDGTVVYMLGNDDQNVYQFDISPAWDIT